MGVPVIQACCSGEVALRAKLPHLRVGIRALRATPIAHAHRPDQKYIFKITRDTELYYDGKEQKLNCEESKLTRQQQA